MRRSTVGFVGVALAVIVGLAFAADRPIQNKSRFLHGLTKGQSVLLKDLGTMYEIDLLPNDAAKFGQEVVEIGDDYVVIRDITGFRETRVSVSSIRAIVKMKVK